MKTKLLLAPVVLSTLFATGVANAAEGYVTDSRDVVVKSGNGSCWKTGYWTPSMATAECDPDMVPRPKVAERPTAKPVSPEPGPAPAKAATQDITLATDGLFAFGKAMLLPKGRIKLDEFVGKIQGHPIERILIVGHTDRLGSQALNQRLSLKRAAAVKAYLVSKNIDRRLIRVGGKGSTEPVTAPKQCPGKGGAKVIACLAPDRRVEIKVSGLK